MLVNLINEYKIICLYKKNKWKFCIYTLFLEVIKLNNIYSNKTNKFDWGFLFYDNLNLYTR